MNNSELREALDILHKVKTRSKRLQESTQNASQASLDMLYSDAVDAYWAFHAIIQKQENIAKSTAVDTPLPPWAE
jgi:hypothetical protein